MWRKQSEAKPSSPAMPSRHDTPNSSFGSRASSIPAASSAPSQTAFAPAPASDAAVLTRGICIKGELTGKADLLIDGDVQGSIRLGDSRLTVGQLGRIRADIEASEILVRGEVEGDLRGRERVILGSSSRVVGDLEAPRVAIEEGARFKGRVEMGPAADARERQTKKGPSSAALRENSLPGAETDSPVAVETQRSSH